MATNTKKPPTKSEIYAKIVDDTGLTRKDVAAVFESLNGQIKKNLGGRGQSRPRKVRTLKNTINALFTKKLDDKELSTLVREMQKRKLIVVNQNNVSYKLPH